MNPTNAKQVATRKNNQARKRLLAERAAAPLLADQLPTVDLLPVITPADVIEKHKAAREAHAEWRTQFNARAERRHADQRARIAALVSEAEYAEIARQAADCNWGETVGWDIAEMRINRRREPLTNDEQFVLALLCNQERDVTLDELHRACGDGLSRDVMMRALFSLQDRGLAGGGLLRRCTVTGQWRAPWQITTAGRELA